MHGFYRACLLDEGRIIYVADHKAPSGSPPIETYDWLYRDGTRAIPNTYWSMVTTLSDDDLNKIENPDIREETRKAQRLMLAHPAQFVGLMTIGNRLLIEPDGFGWKVLPENEKLRAGPIEVYDHDVSKIIIGQPQSKYNNAKLYLDESIKDDAVRYAVRGDYWLADDRRFGVDLDCGPRCSAPDVAGLGFRFEGNQAYAGSNANQLIEGLMDIEQKVVAMKNSLK